MHCKAFSSTPWAPGFYNPKHLWTLLNVPEVTNNIAYLRTAEADQGTVDGAEVESYLASDSSQALVPGLGGKEGNREEEKGRRQGRKEAET